VAFAMLLDQDNRRQLSPWVRPNFHGYASNLDRRGTLAWLAAATVTLVHRRGFGHGSDDLLTLQLLSPIVPIPAWAGLRESLRSLELEAGFD
jgi:hypothetical protein